jgi:hypothetical protein
MVMLPEGFAVGYLLYPSKPLKEDFYNLLRVVEEAKKRARRF